MRSPTTFRSLRNEYAKMRCLRIGLLASLLLLGVIAVTVVTAMSSGLANHIGDDDGYAWRLLLVSLHSSVVLVGPILLAVMASRQVEIEHSSNGWSFSATAGAARGSLCWAKYFALSSVVLPTPILWGCFVLAFGRLVGITSPFPTYRAAVLLAGLTAVNLAALGLQILLSSHADNQLGPLAAGLMGILLGMFATAMPLWVRHLTPWTAYGLIVPADFVGQHLVDVEMHLGALLALCGVGATLFFAVTVYYDRRDEV